MWAKAVKCAGVRDGACTAKSALHERVAELATGAGAPAGLPAGSPASVATSVAEAVAALGTAGASVGGAVQERVTRIVAHGFETASMFIEEITNGLMFCAATCVPTPYLPVQLKELWLLVSAALDACELGSQRLHLLSCALRGLCALLCSSDAFDGDLLTCALGVRVLARCVCECVALFPASLLADAEPMETVFAMPLDKLLPSVLRIAVRHRTSQDVMCRAMHTLYMPLQWMGPRAMRASARALAGHIRELVSLVRSYANETPPGAADFYLDLADFDDVEHEAADLNPVLAADAIQWHGSCVITKVAEAHLAELPAVAVDEVIEYVAHVMRTHRCVLVQQVCVKFFQRVLQTPGMRLPASAALAGALGTVCLLVTLPATTRDRDPDAGFIKGTASTWANLAGYAVECVVHAATDAYAAAHAVVGPRRDRDADHIQHALDLILVQLENARGKHAVTRPRLAETCALLIGNLYLAHRLAKAHGAARPRRLKGKLVHEPAKVSAFERLLSQAQACRAKALDFARDE